MHSGDILGDEGRKAIDACVKLKIFGRPEARLYDHQTALDRLKGCYAGFNKEWRGDKSTWLNVDQLLLPCESKDANYKIIDIHKALDSFDKTRYMYVDKYPNVEGPRYDRVKKVIDEHRADVERECEEATANPAGQHRYSWLAAQRRVRDCYAGNFAGDEPVLPHKDGQFYNISEIYDAYEKYDNMSFVNNIPNVRCISFHDRIKVGEFRASIDREYAEAVSNDESFRSMPWLQEKAKQLVTGCYSQCPSNFADMLPIEKDENGKPKNQIYNIFYVCKILCHIDKIIIFQKYGHDGYTCMGHANIERDLVEEYHEDKLKEYKYSRNEAERWVRYCFAGSFLSNDTNIFPSKADGSGIPKINQKFYIFDIQNAIKYFDSKRLVEKYPEEEGPESDKERKLVDERRADIEREYIEATTDVEIEHGSGFIVQDHFIITNKHVIESALYDETKKTQILISNAVTGDELPCEVAHYDVGKDLALLYCRDLTLNGMCPLQLSNKSLLPGMQIFSFGYPISHTEDTALFVNGYVSGSKKMLSGHTMAVLNCSLNSGNSGGPVLCWVEGQLKVVGVATQKHFKDILILSERQTIEKMRETLQTCVIPEVSQFENSVKDKIPGELSELGKTSMFLLTLKLYDALETHSQFNLSNALPGDLVVEFVKNSLEKYEGDCKDELAEIVKSF